jgi:hypothetical protein
MIASHVSHQANPADDRLLASFLTLGFVSVATYAVLHHELGPATMQALNLVIAIAGIYVFTRYSPFTPLQKALFTLGYFPAYQYTAVSQNYAMGMLGVWACCALAARRPVNILALAVIIGLLAQVSIFGWIIGFALAVALLGDRLRRPDPTDAVAPGGRPWVPALVCAAALTVALVVAWRAAHGANPTRWYFDLEQDRLLHIAQTVPVALLPFRDAGYEGWPVYARARESLPLVFGIVAWGFAALTAIGLLGRRRALVFYGLATGGLLGFFYLKWLGGVNYSGHLYVVLVAAMWLGRSQPAPDREGPVVRRAWALAGGAGLTVLLLAQAVAGLEAIAMSAPPR